MVEESPLKWPVGWRRNQMPELSKFDPKGVFQEAKAVQRQLELMGAENVVISSNMQYRQDGLPYSRQNVSDTGVAVYFTMHGKQQCIPCDRWISLEENLRAIAKTIEALRGIERWGAREMVDAAFSGFKELPASSGTAVNPVKPWNEVLGVLSDASHEEIKRAYHQLAHFHHPDKGGSAAAFQKIRDAYEEGLRA